MVTSVKDDFHFQNPVSDGEVTLREALLAANADMIVGDSTAGDGVDTIRFDPQLSGQSIVLSGLELEIEDGLTIDGSDLSEAITIDATEASRIFYISSELADVRLRGLTITGGRAFDDGGAIKSNSLGTLSLEESLVTGNVAIGEEIFGGGIFARGVVSLRNSTISENRVYGIGLGGGGGVFAYGDVIASKSTISGNAALRVGSRGGGVMSYSSVSLTDTTVSGNTTSSDGGGVWAADNTTITRSTIVYNRSYDSGGAFATNQSPTINIAGSIIAGNSAEDHAGEFQPSDSETSISYSLIGIADGLTIVGQGNQMGTSSAPIDPLLTSLGFHGGVTKTHALQRGSPAIDAGEPGVEVGANDQRGAPFVRKFGTHLDQGAVERQTPISSLLTVNTTIDESDPSNSTVSLREALNTANHSSGAATITFAPELNGETIVLTEGPFAATDEFTIDASSLPDGMAISGSKTTRILQISAGSGDARLIGLTLAHGHDYGGGAISSQSTGSLTLEGTTVRENTTIPKPYSDVFGSGGAISSAGDVLLIESTITGNSTSGIRASGGGVSAMGHVSLHRSTVSENRTYGNRGTGGGIFAGSVTLVDSFVSGNSTHGIFAYGGGIYSEGNFTATHSTISGNTTHGNYSSGGGLFTPSDAAEQVSINESTIEQNSTRGRRSMGGGLYAGNNLSISHSELKENSTNRRDSPGGGIFSAADSMIIWSTLSDNSTNALYSEGGGIYAQSELTVTASTIAFNSTTQNFSSGGGILAFAGVHVLNSTISGNSVIGVVSHGGGINISGGTAQLTHSTIANNESAQGFGGGVSFNESAMIHAEIVSSIVADNLALVGQPDLGVHANSMDIRYSLIGSVDGATFDGIGNHVGSDDVRLDPGLRPLGDNGGKTATHSLLPTSPAIDAGDPAATTLTNDQRDHPFVRLFGSRVDIGAVEQQAFDDVFFVVTTADDEIDFTNSDVSLREAIRLANVDSDPNTITFATQLAGETILLNGSQLTVAHPLVIDASGLAENVAVNAQGLSRVINILAEAGDVQLKGLTLTGGLTDQSGERGAGISSSSSGTLTLNHVVVAGNQTHGTSSSGGGIYAANGVEMYDSHVTENVTMGRYASGAGLVTGGVSALVRSSVRNNRVELGSVGGIAASGTLSLLNSSVTGNSAMSLGSVGGVIAEDLVVTNSTISGNSAGSTGGVSAQGSLSIENSTIADNSAASRAGGISIRYRSDSSIDIRNSIIARNTMADEPSDLNTDQFRFLLNHSILGTTNQLVFGFSGEHNFTGTNESPFDPRIGPLADNGGSTLTHELLTDSAAIDAGAPSVAPSKLSFDQRGTPFLRVVDGMNDGEMRIDIGAFEVASPNLAPIAAAGENGVIRVDSSWTLDGSASTDPDRLPFDLEFSWAIIDAPGNAQLSNSDSVMPIFSAADAGHYEIELTVTDGPTVATDVVTIQVIANTPPIADAGPDLSMRAGQSLELSADGSSDEDMLPSPLSYFWQLVSGPAEPTIINPSNATATFFASTAGDYVVQLTVSDGDDSTTDQVLVHVAANGVPIADAGRSQDTAEPGSTVVLDGSLSFDPDGDPLTHSWLILDQPEGSETSIAGPDLAVTSLEAEVAGEYVVRLVVSDDLDFSEPYDLRILVDFLGWRNTVDSADVNDDGLVNPLDPLLVINDLTDRFYSTTGSGELPSMRPAAAPFLDVDGDGFVTPVDAIIAINRLNEQAANSATRPSRTKSASNMRDEAFADWVRLSKLDFNRDHPCCTFEDMLLEIWL